MGVIVAGLVALWPVGAAPVDAAIAPTVLVRVDNPAGAPNDCLQLAKDRAADVFVRIGVRLTWVDEETAFREQRHAPFTVVIVKSVDVRASRPGVADALGFANPSAGRAHVLYDRVEALTSRSERTPASILGDVIAHELGHLMLSPPGHSLSGIMRRDVETHLRPLETFTGAQARQIVARLADAN